MTEELLIELLFMTMRTTGLLAGPTLVGVVVIGIVINVVQTITQIRDPALAFIPKVVCAAIILLLTASWSLQIMASFSKTMIHLAGRGAF
jgi:flagellar biosynthetic protein FliQ